MKRVIKRISIAAGIILVVVIILHIALFTFINAKGRDLIIGGLRDNLGLEATMGSLSLKFPFNLEVNNFECKALSFKRANVSLGFFNPFTRSISLSKVYIDGLDLKVSKSKDGISLSLPSKDRSKIKDKIILSQEGFTESPSTKVKPGKEEEKSKSEEKIFSLAIGNLYFKNSQIEVDYLIKKRPINIIFSDISLRVKGLTYPKLSRFYIKLDTILVSPFEEGNQRANALSIEGWTDYDNKNMDLNINIDDFDYVAFSKFYPPFWRPNNLRLEEAALSFKSNFKSKGNNLIIDNLLTIESVGFIKEDGEEESFQAKMLKKAIDFLKGDKEKPTLNFKLTTIMDSPRLDFSSLNKRLVEAAGIGTFVIIEGAVDKLKEKIGDLGGVTAGSVIETLKGAGTAIEEIIKSDSEEQLQESKEDTFESKKAPQ